MEEYFTQVISPVQLKERKMDYNLTIEKKDDILWVMATGTRSTETILAMSKDVMVACAKKGVKKVLIDVCELEGRLSTMNAHKIPDEHFPKIRDRSVITHCAIVDLKDFVDSYSFFENVAVNRGFVLRILPDTDEAIEWLNR